MSTVVSEWNTSFQTIQQQISAFNRIPTLESEQVDKINAVVVRETARLKELSDQITGRLEDLNRRCGMRLQSARSLLIAGVVGFASKICTGVALYLTTFCPSIISKEAGFGVAMVGLACDFTATVYVNKVSLVLQESSSLLSITQEGKEQAIKFAHFLETLKKVMTIQELYLSRSLSPSPQPAFFTEECDQLISKCLHSYEELNQDYQSEEAYLKTLSCVIGGLPKDDPLKEELENLSTYQLKKTASTAQEPLHFHYTPDPGKGSRSSSISLLEEEKGQPWTGEQGKPGNTYGPHVRNSISLQVTSDYDKRLEKIKQTAQSRFKLSKPVPYLFSRRGARLE